MRRRIFGTDELAVLALIVLVVGGAAVLLLGGAVDGVAFGSGAAWPHKSEIASVLWALITHPEAPRRAYVMSAARPSKLWELYWLSVGGILVGLLTLGLLVRMAVVRSWRRRPGRQVEERTRAARRSPWASAKTVVNALSAEAAIGRDRGDGTIQPYRLGTSRGHGVYLAYEDSMIVAAPSRSGKTMSVVIPQILQAKGPVVALGTRADAIAATAAVRGRMGRLWLWDPQHLGLDVGSPLRWPLSSGCEVPETARVRAAALGFGAGRGVENGDFWAARTVGVLEALLHAAALSGHDPVLLRRWSASAPSARSAVAVLRESSVAVSGWADGLEAVIDADPRHRDSVWSGVDEALKPLGLPSVERLMSYSALQGFCVEEFLEAPNTLYIIGTARGAVSARPVMAALLDALAEAGRRRAALSISGRLSPPLSFVLDEVAKLCPFPALPELLADGGGSGLATTVIVQALAQLETAWSRSEATEMWANASAKVILGGGADDADLEALSRLVGEWEVEERSETRSEQGGPSIHVSRRKERIAPADFLRELPIGQGILLYRNLPPVRLNLQQWSGRSDGRTLLGHEAALRRAMVASRG